MYRARQLYKQQQQWKHITECQTNRKWWKDSRSYVGNRNEATYLFCNKMSSKKPGDKRLEEMLIVWKERLKSRWWFFIFFFQFSSSWSYFSPFRKGKPKWQLSPFKFRSILCSVQCVCNQSPISTNINQPLVIQTLFTLRFQLGKVPFGLHC